MDPQILLDESQVAKQLKITVKCLQKWRYNKNGPPFIRISAHCVRYRPTDLDAWLTTKTISTT